MPRSATFLTPQFVLAAPPLVAIVLLTAYVTIESVYPGAFTAPRPETISEAIVVGNAPRALEMMAEGLNVDAPARVRPGMFDAREYEVTPLEAALLSRRMETVGLLLHAGADVARSKRLSCLVRERMPDAGPLLGITPSEPPTGDLQTCF